MRIRTREIEMRDLLYNRVVYERGGGLWVDLCLGLLYTVTSKMTVRGSPESYSTEHTPNTLIDFPVARHPCII